MMTDSVRTFRIPPEAHARLVLGVIGSVIREGVLQEIEHAMRGGRPRPLILLIDSPGGSPEIGIELYEKLTEACKSGALILTTCNMKKTESSAVCIYCAGQERWCGNRASFLLHEAAFSPHFKTGGPQDGLGPN
jgi:ATP-dependent protease ClpP protease subunit